MRRGSQPSTLRCARLRLQLLDPRCGATHESCGVLQHQAMHQGLQQGGEVRRGNEGPQQELLERACLRQLQQQHVVARENKLCARQDHECRSSGSRYGVRAMDGRTKRRICCSTEARTEVTGGSPVDTHDRLTEHAARGDARVGRNGCYARMPCCARRWHRAHQRHRRPAACAVRRADARGMARWRQSAASSSHRRCGASVGASLARSWWMRSRSEATVAEAAERVDGDGLGLQERTDASCGGQGERVSVTESRAVGAGHSAYPGDGGEQASRSTAKRRGRRHTRRRGRHAGTVTQSSVGDTALTFHLHSDARVRPVRQRLARKLGEDEGERWRRCSGARVKGANRDKRAASCRRQLSDAGHPRQPLPRIRGGALQQRPCEPLEDARSHHGYQNTAVTCNRCA